MHRLRLASELTTTAGASVANQAAQAGNGVTQLSSGNLGDAEWPGSSKPAQRAFDAQRQNDDADTFGGQRIAEQDHIPLRAAAFESTQHDRQRGSRIETWIFGPRYHLECRLSYWDSNRNSHDADGADQA